MDAIKQISSGISFLKHTSLEVVGVQWCNGEEMQIPNPWAQKSDVHQLVSRWMELEMIMGNGDDRKDQG